MNQDYGLRRGDEGFTDPTLDAAQECIIRDRDAVRPLT